MAVLDGHHDAGDPTSAVGSALGKIVRALPEPVAAQAEAVRRATAPAAARPRGSPARPADHHRTRAGVRSQRRVRLRYRSEAGRGGGELDGGPVGGRRTPQPVVSAVLVAHVRGPAGVPGSTGSAASRCSPTSSSPRPTSTRSPRWRSTSRSAGTTPSRCSSKPRGRGRAVAAAAPGPGRGARPRADAAHRVDRRPRVVRRTADGDPHPLPHRRPAELREAADRIGRNLRAAAGAEGAQRRFTKSSTRPVTSAAASASYVGGRAR